MKKYTLFVILAAFAVTAFAQNCVSAEKAAAPAAEKKIEKKATKKASSKSLKGEVVSIDAVASTIVLKVGKAKKEKEETIVVSDKTKIKKSKKDIALADVLAGDTVSVKYVTEDGKKVAKSVTVSVKKEKKVKKAAPEKM